MCGCVGGWVYMRVCRYGRNVCKYETESDESSFSPDKTTRTSSQCLNTRLASFAHASVSEKVRAWVVPEHGLPARAHCHACGNCIWLELIPW